MVRSRSEVTVALVLGSRPRAPGALEEEGEVLGRLDLPVCDEGMANRVGCEENGSCDEPLLLPSTKGAGASVLRFLLAEKLRNSGSDSELVRESDDGEYADALREEELVLLNDSRDGFWEDGIPKMDACLRTSFTSGFPTRASEVSFASTRREEELALNVFI